MGYLTKVKRNVKAKELYEKTENIERERCRGRMRVEKSSFIEKNTHFVSFLYVPFSISFSLIYKLFLSHLLVISGEMDLCVSRTHSSASLPYMCVCHASYAPLECTRGRISMHLARAVSSTRWRRFVGFAWNMQRRERERARFLSDRAPSRAFPARFSRENIRLLFLFSLFPFFFSRFDENEISPRDEIYLRSASSRLHFGARIERARPLFPVKWRRFLCK